MEKLANIIKIYNICSGNNKLQIYSLLVQIISVNHIADKGLIVKIRNSQSLKIIQQWNIPMYILEWKLFAIDIDKVAMCLECRTRGGNPVISTGPYAPIESSACIHYSSELCRILSNSTSDPWVPRSQNENYCEKFITTLRKPFSVPSNNYKNQTGRMSSWNPLEKALYWP